MPNIELIKMGIKNLNKILQKYCPEVFQPVHISEYAFERIAIDISHYLYTYKISRGEMWLLSFFNLISCLRKNNVHCVFLYDNGCPPEKALAHEKRSKSKSSSFLRISDQEKSLQNYCDSGQIDDVLIKLNKDSNKGTLPGLLNPERENIINVNACKMEIGRKKSQQVVITEEDCLLTKQLFDILKVPWFDAVLEAETSCADLCIREHVVAVISEDTDVLAYGTPIQLSKFDTMTGNCIRVCHQDVLEGLEFSQDSFLDMCIMCGTDYNDNIPGVGMIGAHQNIKQYKSIENIKEQTSLDITNLNHTRSRELFKKYKNLEVEIPYCGNPDFEKLQEFSKKHKLNLNIRKIQEDMTRDSVVSFE